MFSSNPITRRRQKKAAAFFVLSGVFTAVGMSRALVGSATPLREVGGGLTTLSVPISRASFGRVALSPDGELQVELHAEGKVVVRERQTQQPVSVFSAASIVGVRFAPEGEALLVRRLQLPDQPAQEFLVLQDHLMVVDPRTGTVKNEGQFHLTP